MGDSGTAAGRATYQETWTWVNEEEGPPSYPTIPERSAAAVGDAYAPGLLLASASSGVDWISGSVSKPFPNNHSGASYNEQGSVALSITPVSTTMFYATTSLLINASASGSNGIVYANSNASAVILGSP